MAGQLGGGSGDVGGGVLGDWWGGVSGVGVHLIMRSVGHSGVAVAILDGGVVDATHGVVVMVHRRVIVHNFRGVVEVGRRARVEE